MTPPDPTKAASRVSLLRRIRMGAGYLPGYGQHPGTSAVVLLTLLTGAAGSHAGWMGFIGGCTIGGSVYGPLWLYGCVGRANAYLRRTELDSRGREG